MSSFTGLPLMGTHECLHSTMPLLRKMSTSSSMSTATLLRQRERRAVLRVLSHGAHMKPPAKIHTSHHNFPQRECPSRTAAPASCDRAWPAPPARPLPLPLRSAPPRPNRLVG